jgi:hypothetical protein
LGDVERQPVQRETLAVGVREIFADNERQTQIEL